MMLNFGGRLNMQPEYTAQLEARLQQALRPVAPRHEFEEDLKKRLLSAPEASLAERKPGLMQYFLLTAAGLLSGSLLLIFGVRAVQYLRADKVSKAATAL